MRSPTGYRRLASVIAAAVVLAACSGDDAIRGMDLVDEPSSPEDPTAEIEDADGGDIAAGWTLVELQDDGTVGLEIGFEVTGLLAR